MVVNAAYPYTATAASTIINDADNGFNQEAASFRSTATTTTGTPVTVGVVPHGAESSIALALCEILASGTLTEDASTPAAVPVSGSGTLPLTMTITTASFNPPAGALLVAMATTNTATAITITDTSGLGLTWVPQVASSNGDATVWTAQIPGGGGGAVFTPYGTPHPVTTKPNTFTGTDPTADIGEPGFLGQQIGRP